ncbi:hypothetical protein PR048_015962 [Dryococelus australis]|uniref:Uncharacterized protein n=1 Tax=Dryococelus australis TaxID=614101 RepID=A0ABQ9HIK9_9NEOP|nr:hypothetical protein PR048_015962 [Dryococelus australis]
MARAKKLYVRLVGSVIFLWIMNSISGSLIFTESCLMLTLYSNNYTDSLSIKNGVECLYKLNKVCEIALKLYRATFKVDEMTGSAPKRCRSEDLCIAAK